MQAPHTTSIGRANGSGEEDVERGQFGGGVRIGGREEVVWRQPSGVEGAMVGSEAADRLRILQEFI